MSEDKAERDHGYGVNGDGDRSIGAGTPVPSMLRWHYSSRLLPPLHPRRPYRETLVRRLDWRFALLLILWFLLESTLLCAYVG